MELTDYPYRDQYGEILDQYLSGKLDKNTFMPNKHWLELYVDPSNPAMSTLRCKYCYHYGPVFHIIPRFKGPLFKREGALQLTKAQNKQMIKEHLKSEAHEEIFKALKDRKIDELFDIKRPEPKHHKVTNNIYRTLYYEVMTGLSFKSHKSMVELQARNGAEMGNMCRSQMIAKRMTTHLSEEMHKELLAYLKEKKPYLSLIMDGSKHYISLNGHTYRSRPI